PGSPGRWRRPAGGRSVRPRTGAVRPRSSRSPRKARVELAREESRGGLEDLVGPAELPVLPLELGDAAVLLGGDPWAAPAVDLGLADPVAQGLWADVELAGDPA